MANIPTQNKKLLKELQAKLKTLQAELVEANKLEGNDAYIDVKIKKNQARFERVKQKDVEDKAVGKFFIEIEVKAKQQEVFIPISIASGKKAAGFMYQIEGTSAGSIMTTDIKTRGEDASQVMLGTLRYAKIPVGKTVLFQIQVAIRGKFHKRYKIVITRLNYKLRLTDARYEQYLKEIHSDSIELS